MRVYINYHFLYMSNLTRPLSSSKEGITVHINQKHASNQIVLDYRLGEFHEDLQEELKGYSDDYLKQAKAVRESCDELQGFYTAVVSRLVWEEGSGHANKRAFMKFLLYHGIEAQSVHKRCIFFPRYKMPNNSKAHKLVFLDDGTVIITPKHGRFSVNTTYYESRYFYGKLVKYLSLRDLEVIHRL